MVCRSTIREEISISHTSPLQTSTALRLCVARRVQVMAPTRLPLRFRWLPVREHRGTASPAGSADSKADRLGPIDIARAFQAPLKHSTIRLQRNICTQTVHTLMMPIET